MGRRSLWLVAVVVVGVALWMLAWEPRAMLDDEPLPSAPIALETERAAEPELDRETQVSPSQAEPESEPANPAAPAAPPQAPTAQPEDSAALPPPGRSGPVAKLQQAFEEEPRDSAAHDPESRIESEFRNTDIMPGTLRSVLCRTSVCKVEVLWTPERAFSFMAAFTRLSADFEPGMAIDPHGMAGSPQQLQVDVYLPRRGARTNP